jgi:hypothetical protein
LIYLKKKGVEMIGMRHQKSADLSFQSEHDYSVAHKTKNKVPFYPDKVNVMYEFDKNGVEKKTEFYRMKFKQDYLYVEKYLQNGKLTIEDMNFKKNISEEDKKRRFNHINELLNKLDKDILKNSLDNFKNAPKIAAWYKQQEKNKRQSAKKTHGKAEHKSIQPFMTNVIFFGKEDINIGDKYEISELDERVKKFVDKFQKKYNIPKESIKIARHEDETSLHYHFTFLNWNEKTKHFNNKEMSKVKDIQGHLDLLEEEFKDILYNTRTKYIDSKKEKHKTLVEYNAELVKESKQVEADLINKHFEVLKKDKVLTSQKTIIDFTEKQTAKVKNELTDVKNVLSEKTQELRKQQNHIINNQDLINKIENKRIELSKLNETIENKKTELQEINQDNFFISENNKVRLDISFFGLKKIIEGIGKLLGLDKKEVIEKISGFYHNDKNMFKDKFERAELQAKNLDKFKTNDKNINKQLTI